MGWYVHHVNIQVYDVPEAVAFYRDVIGLEEGTWTYPEGADRSTAKGRRAFFGSENRGMHIVRADPAFQRRNGFDHNPTIGGHFAVTVPDADAVKARLEAAGHMVTDAGVYAMAGVRQLYVWDPCWNMVEINAIADPTGGAAPAPDEAHGVRTEAGGWRLHHVNIEAHDVRAAAAFYRDLIGMEESGWTTPAGSEIAADAQDKSLLSPFGDDFRGLHIVKPQPAFAKRNGFDHNPTIGGHFALQLDDLDAAVRRLDAAGVLYTDAGSYAMAGIRQIYLYDPSMNFVELNASA